MKNFIVKIFLLCLSFAATQAAVKSWQFTTNFDDEKNWDLNRLPCSNDRVYFDSRKSAVILLSSSFSFKEVILPRNGEIILADNSKISASLASSCKGKDIHFLADGIRDWYDVSNWKITSEFLLNSKGDVSPIPHTERIPCQYDDVVFPNNSSFQILLSEDIKIGTLNINGKRYSTEEFKEFRETQTGKAFFKGNDQFVASGEKCAKATGCSCFNSRSDIKSRICQQIICKAANCLDPLNVPGHCCPICGSSIEIDYKPKKFDIKKTRDFISSQLKDDEAYTNVGCYIYLWKNLAYVICLDSDNNKKSSLFANDIFKTLSRDESIKGIKVTVSNQWKDTTFKDDTGLVKVLGTLLGILLAIFLVIGAIVLYRKHRYRDLNFVRFDREVSKVVMELGTTPHEDLLPTDFPTAPPAPEPPVSERRTFKNPLFGFKLKTPSFKGYSGTDMTNPIYGIDEENLDP